MKHLLLMTLVLVACGDKDGDSNDGDSHDSVLTGDDTADTEVAPADEQVVTFETADGETLEADWYPANQADAGAVLLFHMIPPGNDRSGYPPHVRRALHDQGVAVLNVDRRGAGGSTGIAADAYTGPGGLQDVQAAVDYALAQGVNPDALVLVGASNGSTSVFDYVMGRQGDRPAPAAVVFMSPGDYTEAQHSFPSDLGSLELPWLWLYPTNEPYSQDFVDGAPTSWSFVEDGAAHGTRMFDGGALEERTLAQLTAWVAR